ncbi:NEAT domain-containing protein [Bacillus pumilus]|uniref:NEAT domain-containing protein n=1 Tax=Bacillus pumilus TaxID=1408 RepID=UPI00081FBBC4|nr:NEAT domain-containing protein [Bacillus pumilus]AOC58321.1 cell surface protein [Bacillus pumilus]MBR0586895.1 sortase B protein-sorting domain-containing protein [Bacillus pumilus DW2J2]MBR0616127.1 sortase B protein-sorting domain-containing protein [Bacillus pumilus]MBR0624644.1 sortase B protein-sorting domain-containing protein [Bacillus pumilus]MCY7722674.1 NEAT domain-containing protein [Bacillus pumilus]
MKRLFHLKAAILLVLFSLLTAFQIPQGTAQAASFVDGEYTAGFTILKNGSTEASMMDTYTEKPAKLIVENGKTTAYVTLKQSKEITDFKVEQNGALVTTETVSEDETANTRVIKFDVADLSAKLNGWVKIYWDLGGFIYDEAYDVQLAFDQSSLTLVTPAKPDDNETKPDDQNGSKPDDNETKPDDQNGSKPDDNETKPDDQNGTKPDDHQATPGNNNGTKPDDSAQNQLKDGEYRINYSVLKGDQDEASRMNQYFSHPASLTIKNGKQTISFTVKDHTSVASLKTEKNGSYQEVKTVSTDKAKNTRVVSFDVADLKKAVKGKVHIVVAAAHYDQTYDIRFQFDAKSIAPLKDGQVEEETPASPETPKPNTPSPETNNGGAAQETAKLKDGVYKLPFSMKKADKDEPSRMNDYVVSPATLVVKNGRHFVSYTVKNSSTITSFQVGTGGKYEETLVAKTDQKADTRVIQYEAKSLSTAQAARVKIDIPAANYHEQYDVKLVYDTKGITLGEGSGIAMVIGDDESIGFVKNPNDRDSQTNQLENLAPEETGAEQMTFTPSDDQTKSETGQLNPKTGDTSLFWVYILLFGGSLFVLVRKYQTRTR